MEEYLFYNYLKYLKDNDKTFWKGLFKLPWWIIVLFFSIIIVLVLSIIYAVFNCAIGALISVFIACVLSIVIHFVVANYRIEFSEERLAEYKKHCIDVLDWLKNNDIHSEEEITSILERVKNNIGVQKDELYKKSEVTFKWMQTLIIPIIIVAFTAMLSSYDDVQIIVYLALSAIFVFALLYSVFGSIKSIVLLPSKRRVEQMQCFANDLQGVLDCMKYVNEKTELSTEKPEEQIKN